MENYLPLGYRRCLEIRSTHGPFSCEDDSRYLDLAIYKEIMNGNGTEAKGIYVDFRDLRKACLRENPLFKRWYAWLLKESGIDIFQELIEISPLAHSFNGGVRIDEKASTCIDGLFAAGEVAGGMHGALRLGGNMVTATQVFGKRAGEYAGKRAKHIKELAIDKRQVDSIKETISDILQRKEGIVPNHIKQKIQGLMYENVFIAKTEEGLKGTLSELKRIEQEEIPYLFIENEDNLKDVFEVKNLLGVGMIVTKSSLDRRESKGSHFREDSS